jgi:high-affinity iron transporter
MAPLPLLRAVLALILLSTPGIGLGAEPTPRALADRMLVLLGAAAEEYREALDEQGRVVRPFELDEARLLLAEARERGHRLPSTLAAEVARRLAALEQAVEAHAPESTVTAEVGQLRGILAEATGARDDPTPPAVPSPARGRTVFATHCAGCHGAHGRGDGPDAAGLVRRPADFTDPSFMRGETPSDFFHVVSAGKRLGAMPAWDEVLSVQERWDVVSHVWSLASSPQTITQGRDVFAGRCARCHGEDLSTPGALVGRSDRDLYDVVGRGVPDTMPAFEAALTETDRWAVVAFVRGLSLGTTGGAAPGAGGDDGVGRPLAETRRLLAAALDAYRRGDPAASDLATDAYFRFEPLERRLGATDPAAVRRVEEAFLRLRTALRRPGAVAEAEEVGTVLRGELDAVEAGARGTADAFARFVQSATIILREGFEAVLIIGALLTYVVRAGHARMRRPLHVGTVLGLAASLATAALATTLLPPGAGASEILEGVTMLLAAAVLFWVSYWIVSKAEAERWQRYIRGKVEAALASGNGAALAATAFLAVFREGFETVLFYRALLASAPPGDAMVGAGFAAGVVLLGAVYLLVRRIGLRLPTARLFRVTGTLLYAMAFAFAGTGVHELQEAGVVRLTPVGWVPSVAFLGIYPTVESLLVQAVFIALLVYATVATIRTRRARAAADMDAARAELHRLRELAEALRAEVAALRADDARGIDGRLDGLVARVRELEARLASGNGRG